MSTDNLPSNENADREIMWLKQWSQLLQKINFKLVIDDGVQVLVAPRATKCLWIELPPTTIHWSLSGYQKCHLIGSKPCQVSCKMWPWSNKSCPLPSQRPEMFITYDKGIPAKIGLTKISRRTKVLVYGKFPKPIRWCKSVIAALHYISAGHHGIWINQLLFEWE